MIQKQGRWWRGNLDNSHVTKTRRMRGKQTTMGPPVDTTLFIPRATTGELRNSDIILLHLVYNPGCEIGSSQSSSGPHSLSPGLNPGGGRAKPRTSSQTSVLFMMEFLCSVAYQNNATLCYRPFVYTHGPISQPKSNWQ